MRSPKKMEWMQRTRKLVEIRIAQAVDQNMACHVKCNDQHDHCSDVTSWIRGRSHETIRNESKHKKLDPDVYLLVLKE